ncbi:class I adenylate-forming enzyme family protein [Arthrobacter sp. 135MFCol5.1]|uniref:class I adenylate-forming enzyme family protein n=1 Tax=Arthrobacter sp. 135MFCol5.1 TaxID=1158050 RepID=UPI0003A49C0C|nr:AMP-binding protein [Arthrobacter sp. 135MFCol5.1]
MPFLDKIQMWADRRPDDTAVVVNRGGYTWAELCAAAEQLLPSTPQISILCEPNSPEFVARFCAGVASGRQAAVLDPAWTEQSRTAVLQKLPRPSPAGGTALEDGDPDWPFLIGFTSGTTSTPKAFIRSRRSWQTSFQASIEFFGLRPDDKTLAPGPLAATLNLYALSECLYSGTEFHSLHSFDVGDAHSAITHDGITRLVVVPTMLRLLSERGLTSGVDASAITSIVCAGSKLDARTLRAARRWAPNATIFEYYGAAELSFVAGRELGPKDLLDTEGTAIGRPFPGVEIQITDDEGKPVVEGTPGNISIRSAMVCQGYLWGDDGTSFRVVDGRYTVGDQGYLKGSELHILGRSADMVNTAGRNVYPHEVEIALAAIPGVEAAVAAGVPDDLRGQRMVAAILPSCGSLTAIALRAGLEEALSTDKMPRDYYLLDELPVTDRGKISRGMLQEWISSMDPRVRRLP